MIPQRFRLTVRLLAAAVAFLAAAEAGRYLTVERETFTLFWPPSGVFLFALLTTEPRRWALVALVLLVPALAYDLPHGSSLAMTLAFHAWNSLEAILIAGMLRRRLGHRPELDRLDDVATFILAVIIGTGLAALPAALWLRIATGMRFGEAFPTWWGGTALGALVVTPALLAFRGRPLWPRLGAAARALEALAAAAGTLLAARLAFGAERLTVAGQELLLLGPLVWVALRLGTRGTALACLFLPAAVLWGVRTNPDRHLLLTSTTSAAPTLQVLLILPVATLLILTAAVAERRRTALTMRQTNVLLLLTSHALDRVVDPLVIADADSRVVYGNQAFASLVGVPQAEIAGEALEALAGIDPADHRRRWASLAPGDRLVEEAALAPPRGSGGSYELASGLFEFEGRRLLVMTARDLAERRQADRALRMATVGTLASSIAHEINNPLSYVISNVETARDQLRREPPGLQLASEALADAAEGAERVRWIVGELRRYARAPDDAELAPVDPARAVRSAVALSQNEIRHRAQLEVSLEDLPPVRASEQRLVQVLVNLLLNAAQAIHPGQTAHHRVRVTGRRGPGGEAVLAISDTGVGMSPEVQARLFEPFFTTKPTGVGTGLGLSISVGIVGRLGGRIEVESAPGQGSTFRVILPPADAPAATGAAAAAAPAARPVAAGSGPRVLVVDDEPLVRRAVGRILEGSYRVELAASGREALGRLEGGVVCDALVCDLMMPDMTGMQLHTVLQERWPALAGRTLFLTGGISSPEVQAFLEGATNPRLEKPFQPPALLAELAALLSGP